MTINDAKVVRSLIDTYEDLERLPHKVQKLHKNGDIDELANLLYTIIDRCKVDVEIKISDEYWKYKK